MQIIDCLQRSPEWWRIRRGLPTASSFDKLLTPARMKPSASQDSWICELVAERFASVWPNEGGYVSSSMQHGIDTEDTARRWYEFDNDVEVTQVGFCLSDCGRFGCSPDGLVGDDGLLELKCPDAHTHVQYLLSGDLPLEYKCQCHGSLAVTGRKWIDFMSFHEDFPPLVVRVEPDFFTAKLQVEIVKFCDRLDAAVKRIEELRGVKACATVG